MSGEADLSLAELQHLGQTLSLGWGEVFLSLELLFQLDGLVIGEPHLTAFPFVQRSLEKGAPKQGLACGPEELWLTKTPAPSAQFPDPPGPK